MEFIEDELNYQHQNMDNVPAIRNSTGVINLIKVCLQ